MLTLEGLVRNVLSQSFKEKTDPLTGDITPASTTFKVQIEYTQPQQNGENKIVIDDFNLKCDGDLTKFLDGYRACVGKLVRVPVALWKIDGKAGLAIPKGVFPVVLQSQQQKAA